VPQGLAALAPVLERNMTLRQGADIATLSEAVAAMVAAIGGASSEALLAGEFAFDPA
jgi:hypothetical protein